MLQSQDFIVNVCFFIETHPRKHGTRSFLFYPGIVTWQCCTALPIKPQPTPAPLRRRAADERRAVCRELANRSGRLSVNSSPGIRRGPRSLPALNPLTLHRNTATVRVPHLPLNLRSVGGSRIRTCSSLDMFLAGEVTLSLGEQLSAARSIRNPSTESLSARRVPATHERAGPSDRARGKLNLLCLYW